MTIVGEATYPNLLYTDKRAQAIITSVWTLTEDEIQTYLQFILKRRCTVRQFISALNTDHDWKLRIPLPGNSRLFDIYFKDCSYTSLVVRDCDTTQLILSFRRMKNCPLRVVIVRPFTPIAKDLQRNPEYDFYDVKPLFSEAES